MEIKNSCKAPISGETIDLSEVNDPVFSNKILGDGVAIRPNENIVSSPVDGILKLMFHTGHAFVIETENGDEIMVHIGIDTVQYQGKGFFVLKEQGSQVKAGEEIVSFEKKYLDLADMSTMLIYMDEEKKKALDKKIGITCKRAVDTVLEW